MEEKIIGILDELDVSQAEALLEENINIKIDKNTINKIKNSVYKKAGVNKKVYSPKKLVAAAAVLVVLVSSAYAIGFDNIAMAFNRLFSFIPEYGIVENNDSIQYILAEKTFAENGDAVLTLNNAIAGKEDITIMFTLEKENGYKELPDIKEKAVLIVNGRRHTEFSGSSSGGGKSTVSCLTFKVNAEDISTSNKYKFEYEDMYLEFSLKDYNTSDTLNEIGSTENKNDISITVVPTFMSDDKVEINIYPINKSRFSIDSFFGQGKLYFGTDLYLETNSGIKPYNAPESYGMAHGKFTFDINPLDTDFTLKIPFIIVQSPEEQNITLKIPKEGEKIQVNSRIQFKDSDMLITEIERDNENAWENGALKMTIKYENKTPNMTMMRTSLVRTNIFGGIDGGGYSTEVDENGITQVIYFALEDGDKNTLRLKFSNPVYYMADDYSLDFKRE